MPDLCASSPLGIAAVNRRLRAWLGAFALAAALPSVARAQQPEPPPLVPPTVTHREEAAYPADATGAASVILEILVQEDGHVGEVRVVDGAEPFATAATSAVKAYTFTPAKRGDKVVSARIRVVVEFTPAADCSSVGTGHADDRSRRRPRR